MVNLENAYSTARNDFLDYCILANPKYCINWHHDIVGQELVRAEKRVIKGGDRQLFIFLLVPPRHGKSEEASILFPSWFLGRNPDKEIITSSYSADLAQDFGSKTRDIMQSTEYSFIFPEVALRQDSKSKAKWVTEQGGGYTSVGVGGPLTGRGAHILLIDDPVKSREEADSETIQEKIWEWFRSTAYSRLEPNGVVIIIMQRWHKQDLVGKIEAEFKDREDIDLRVLKFPAVAIEDGKQRKTGEALWPQRYDEKALATIRRTVGEVNWASQYQQEPILMENQEFRPEYFKYFEEEDLVGKDLEYTITVDLATGDKEVKNGDDVVITTVGKEKGKPQCSAANHC